MLFGVDRALGWDQFDDLNPIVDLPAMRPRAVAQLMLGFSEADIDAGLALRSAGHQELQRNRGLAGTWTAFEQMQAVARQPSTQNVVEANNPSGRARKRYRRFSHGDVERLITFPVTIVTPVIGGLWQQWTEQLHITVGSRRPTQDTQPASAGSFLRSSSPGAASPPRPPASLRPRPVG